MIQGIEHIEHSLNNTGAWETTKEFLSRHISFGKEINVSILDIIIVVTAIFVTTIVLRMVLKLITRNLPTEDKGKFNVVYGYFRWLVYLVILLITLHSVGVNVTAVFAASAALLIGVGLALQTLFQDIISGVFILIDQTVHVGDIIEIEGKVGRVEEIKLRTTRAVTIDNKMLIIPNHLYLNNTLYNWTQNGTTTRENIEIGLPHGCDVQLVKKLLLQAATSHKDVFKEPAPVVLFTNFGKSSLDFMLVFTLSDSFTARYPKSDIRFEIDRLLRENNIKIPIPQRGIHMISTKPPL